MTNLGSILKSRDITLPAKIRLVKTMFFPVVMYEYESWTVRRLSAEESMLPNCGAEKTLESPLDCKEVKPAILKEINPEYSLEGLVLKLKLQSFGHMM